MLKPTLALAAAGFLGVVLWKVLLLPLLAGVLGFVLKLALVAGVALLIFWVLHRKDAKPGDEARAD
ncbi:MAG: hypothetical protein ACREL9_09515 [Gemmatimonadales bacterium]